MHITLSHGQLWGSLIMVHLIPTYRQQLKSAKPVLRTVKRLANEAEWDLQACFHLADWTVFQAAASYLDELTETVPSCISLLTTHPPHAPPTDRVDGGEQWGENSQAPEVSR